MNFYTKIGGSLVKAMTLSSLTSSTNNLLTINGATSVLSVYNVLGTIGTFSSNLTISKASAPNLTITSSAAGTQSQLFFITDNQTWEMGSRGSTALNPTNFYIYNGGFNMLMTPAGITTFLNATNATTISTGGLILSGGLGIAKDIYSSGLITTTNTTSSTAYTNGSIITAGGIGVAKASYFNSNVSMGTTSGGIMIGTSTDNARLLSCLQSGLTATNSNYITFGQAATSNNQVELSFYYAGSTLTTNRFDVGFFGGNRLLSLTAG